MNSTDTPPTDDVLIKVGKDGRLIIPRAIVEKQSLKPGDFVAAQSVALAKAQMNRRTWLKWAIGTGVLVGLEYSSQIRHAIENWNFVKELYTEYVDIDRPLLTHLFGAPK